MSYRNPQIVQPSKAGEIYAQAIAGFGKQAAGTIQAIGDKKRAEEKRIDDQNELLRKQYNKVDIENAEMSADFYQKIQDNQFADQARPIINQAVEKYGDAKIALLTEKDPSMRVFYKKQLQKNYGTLLGLQSFIESIQGEVSLYNDRNTSSKLGNTIGIAGDPNQQFINSEYMQALGGRLKDGRMEMQLNDDGSVDLAAFDGNRKIRSINSSRYSQSGNEIIFTAPDTVNQTTKDLDAIILKDGNIKKEYLSDPEIRRFASGKDNFEQTISRVDINGMIKAGEPVFNGAAAVFEGMDSQTKNFVWTNQLKQTTGIKGAIEATKEDVAKLYANKARETYMSELNAEMAEINGETVYFQGGKPKLVKPEKIDKADDTKKLTAAERKAKLAEDRAVSLVKKLDEDGVQTFIKSISAGTQFKQLGDVVTLLNVDTDGKTTPGTSYNLGTKSGKESFLNDFAKAKYGSGADFDLIQDYIGKEIQTSAKEVEGPSVNAGPIDYSQFLIKE